MYRDLEAQVAIVTKNHSLQQRLHDVRFANEQLPVWSDFRHEFFTVGNHVSRGIISVRQ